MNVFRSGDDEQNFFLVRTHKYNVLAAGTMKKLHASTKEYFTVHLQYQHEQANWSMLERSLLLALGILDNHIRREQD